ncbi:heat shock protein Hsp20 [Tistlia consotensis]|uniref:HSP20 family protein n=1 Tax=Tistlia consotensis USBA 355 TaxID=560819 RepID=A0A1Y6B8H9_9PROT|nr:Hsp20/alpha crystallin family protein [Tistlia consotensis]SME97017.1 HSP20 family protein [Tistlia consotensis USBA 355]SNR56431.1 heat shock protein Hsp20 [Tistlia consotensis]
MSDTSKTGGKTPATSGGINPMTAWRSQMDRAFEDFFRGWGLPGFAQPLEMASASRAMIAPRIDVRESDGTVEISAELPGMADKDVKVTVHEGVLTIEGEKKEESESREADVWLSERHYGSFRRSFSLPDTLDAEKVAARFDKGVLKVTLPKKAGGAKPQPRSIPIG